MAPDPIIRVDVAPSQQTYSNGQAALGQQPPATPGVNGVRMNLLGAAQGYGTGHQTDLSGAATRSGNAGLFTNALDQTSRDASGRLAGIQAPGMSGSSGAGTGLLDKVGAARLAPSDVLNAALNPYQSNNPLLKAVQGIPGIASQVVNAPMQLMQSGFSPIQSMLSSTVPGGTQAAQEILSRSNARGGFDGGPVSLALGGGDGTERGQRMMQIAESVNQKYPYAWGGGGPNGPGYGISDNGGPGDAAGDPGKIGFDCSGLAQYVWKQMYGIVIPEVSQTQFSGGIPVSAANAKPGDLVFPGYAFKGGPPTHVQILMPGGQTVLEAPSSGQMVKISPLSSGSQFRTFASAA